MKKLVNADYRKVVKYAFLFCLFIIFNNVENTVLPYSVCILNTSLAFNSSLFLSPLLFLLSFLILGEFSLMASVSIIALFCTSVAFIYRKTATKMKYEVVLYTALSLLAFIILGDSKVFISLEKKILTCLIATALTLICYVSGIAITTKGLKYKLRYEEFASISILVAITGLGISNVLSPYVWQSISIFIILLSCFIYKKGLSSLIALALSVSLAIYYGNLNYVALFLLYSLCAESLMPLSRYLSAISILLCDYLVYAIFSMYSVYLLQNFLCVFIGALAFSVIPTKPLRKLKEKLYLFREKHLSRVAINRNRIMLSNRLYELSNVFNEMSNAFSAFTKKAMSENSIKMAMRKEIFQSVCQTCDNRLRCASYEKQTEEGIETMIDIGFAKGKLSLIDLPKNLSDKCIHPNNIIFGLNRLLASYRSYLLERANLENGRSLIATETAGIAEILKGLALESGAILKYQSRAERLLSNNLYKNGFMVSELLIYGEEEGITVGLILTMKEFSLDKLLDLLRETFGVSMSLVDKSSVTDDKCYLSFKKAVSYDAVFGVSMSVKDNSSLSGDTHSITRISNNKFLIALSDGMGSGEYAQNISSVSLSLIESFYKAGMDSNLILNTVNKLLSINTEDSFTALDISVIDLKDCSADFIKYGSPYGFIISENGVKILEGNTLPLGILEELKPSVCKVNLSDGDMIVFVTDGVSDAFGSSSEVINFLRSVPAKNPQSLADELLNQAVQLSNGQKKDDMTVLAVRIFSNAV